MLNWIKSPVRNLLALPLLFGALPSIYADECEDCSYGCDISLGPECYRFCREREGGTSQAGYMWGGRLEFERIKRSSIYVGVSALYAKGELNGHSTHAVTGVESRLKSHVTDEDIEGRLGFTFQTCTQKIFSFTPFVGGGYFRESHRYVHPSPLTIHYRNSFPYVSAGFLSTIDLSSCWDIGLNFKTRYIVDGQNKITDDPDPEVDDVTIAIGNKFQYRVELPISYYFCYCSSTWEASFVPFYEFRHYGGHPNYPFDFLETKIQLYGARLTLAYCF